MNNNHRNVHLSFLRESRTLHYSLRSPLVASLIAGAILTSCGTTSPAILDDADDISSSTEMQSSSESTSSSSSASSDHTSSSLSKKTSQYQNGSFSTIAQYRAPSGEEEIHVTLTLKNDIITDANYAGTATVGKSERYQKAFGEGYKQYVVGKKIDALSLDIVSGASLTTKGFMVAVEQVKKMAR